MTWRKFYKENLKKILILDIFQIIEVESNEITLKRYHVAPCFRIYIYIILPSIS